MLLDRSSVDLRHWNTNQIRAHGLGLGGELMASTKIEWTDAVWNPIRGCSRVSEGCRRCYAERQAIRQSGPGGKYEGLVKIRQVERDGKKYREPQWTGKVVFDEEKLQEPLHWKAPRRVFVNSMSDMFHEGVEFSVIGAIWITMAKAKQHTFQILTKRPHRMQAFLKWAEESREPRELNRDLWPDGWPTPNVWLGVSVEDQATADERIPLLLETPAAVRWISAEPLLGPVDLTRLGPDGTQWAGLNTLTGEQPCCHEHPDRSVWHKSLDWVIVGGESGPGARPMHPEWARSLRDQCKSAGVPFFFKQWGEWWHNDGFHLAGDIKAERWRVGKKKAGRLLDGLEWSQYPEARNGHS
jgi:protein gp37